MQLGNQENDTLQRLYGVSFRKYLPRLLPIFC